MINKGIFWLLMAVAILWFVFLFLISLAVCIILWGLDVFILFLSKGKVFLNIDSELLTKLTRVSGSFIILLIQFKEPLIDV